jgi:hypothetical protein
MYILHYSMYYFYIILCIIFILFYVYFILFYVLFLYYSMYILYYYMYYFYIILCIIFRLFYVLFLYYCMYYFYIFLCIIFILFYVLFLYYSMYYFYIILCIFCVYVYKPLPPGIHPIAVGKYIDINIKVTWGQRTERTGIRGGSPLGRGFWGSCNFIQEISYGKIFLNFGTLFLRHVMPWRKTKYHCGGDSWRWGLFTKQLKKWVKVVFLLGCYGRIFHGTGNSAELCPNFGISGEGLNTPKPPSVRHWSHPVVFYQI